jgi:hypothetical protein
MGQFLRIKAYIDALGYKSSALLKPSHPRGLPLRGKEYGLGLQSLKTEYEGTFIDHRPSHFTELC